MVYPVIFSFFFQIIAKSRKVDCFEEGCLSFPTTVAPVTRRVSVTVKYADLDGNEKTEKLTSFEARILQHEIDHLDGVCLHVIIRDCLIIAIIYIYTVDTINRPNGQQ